MKNATPLYMGASRRTPASCVMSVTKSSPPTFWEWAGYYARRLQLPPPSARDHEGIASKSRYLRGLLQYAHRRGLISVAVLPCSPKGTGPVQDMFQVVILNGEIVKYRPGYREMPSNFREDSRYFVMDFPETL